MKLMNSAHIGHYLRIFRHLVPDLRSFVVQAMDGRVLATGGGTAAPVVRACLDALGVRLVRSPADPPRGLRLVSQHELTYVLVLRDTAGTPLGLLALVSDSLGVTPDTPPVEAIARRTGAVVSLLARELELAVPLLMAETAAAHCAEQRLQRAVEQTQTADPGGFERPEALLGSIKALFGCAVAMLYMPACGTERLVGCVPAAAAGAEQLRRLVTRHLYASVRRSGATTMFNKRRECSDTALVPFRVVCVPLKRRDLIVGVIAIANPLHAPPFHDRDCELLEALAPTLYKILGAGYDEDTGLLTRRAFEEEAAKRLADDLLLPRCIVYADVDCLPGMHDSRSARGNQAIRAAAEVWHDALLPGDVLICRLAGDRFAALLENCTLDQARLWAERVRAALAEMRLASGGAALAMDASFGVARLTPDQTLHPALTAARIACRAAKDRDRHRVELFDDIDAPRVQRHDMRFLRDADALDMSRFCLFAQPLVPLAGAGREAHYEILIGKNDDRGNLAPNNFVPVAIRQHLRVRLDKWILTQAIAQLNRHRPTLQTQGTVFWINLSPQSVAQSDFAHFAYDAVRDSVLANGSIAFEMTENAAIGNLHAARRLISRLTELECRFGLDEFGTGLSPLKSLVDLRVSMLKIDGRFVRDVAHEPRLDTVVQAVLQVAHELRLDAAADCIESRAAANHLAALGIAFGQGSELGRPQPLREVLGALSSRRQNPWQRLRASVPEPR